MGVKPDHWIVRMAREQAMIEPFEAALVRKETISFGVSSYGYDFRLDRRFKIFQGSASGVLDPKAVDSRLFRDLEGDTCVLPPHSFCLGQSVEYFRIPRNVLTICFGKSTYARCGVITNITPFEPEWEGHVTISICNTGPSSVKVYAGEGIAQLIFLESEEVCQTSYKERKGKYQAQKGIVVSKVES
ncbi:MAG: dCTP deaminase [Acidobacteriota bacterium]